MHLLTLAKKKNFENTMHNEMHARVGRGVRGGGKKLLESWQNDAADGVKNMERVCDP